MESLFVSQSIMPQKKRLFFFAFMIPFLRVILNYISLSYLSPAVQKQRFLVFRLSIIFFLSAFKICLFFEWYPFHVLLKALGAVIKKVMSSCGFTMITWTITFILSLLNEDLEVLLQNSSTNGFEMSSLEKEADLWGEPSRMACNNSFSSLILLFIIVDVREEVLVEFNGKWYF